MTKITANFILIIMAGVWAAVSIHDWKMVEISQNFIFLALALASGEGLTKAKDMYDKAKKSPPPKVDS